MSIIAMELRAADVSKREVYGVAAPYDQTTHLVSDAGGEELAPGLFTKSITERPTKIPLFLNHEHKMIYGFSRHWEDGPVELAGVFGVREGAAGDQLLADARDGYLPGMSIDFHPVQRRRRADGVVVVREAKLLGVSLVTIPAYENAKVLAIREPGEAPKVDIMAMFGPRPEVDLSPLPPFWR